MALVGKRLFVADTDALLSFPYSDGQTRIAASATRVAELPGAPLNHHWTKNITAVNERDELGSELVPDYMTSVRDGGFYGWPYCHYGQHVDTRGGAAAPRPPAGEPLDVLTGFVANDEAMGRPVGVAIARDGALLVADDVGNVVWRVASATPAAPTASETNRADTIAGESSAHGP